MAASQELRTVRQSLDRILRRNRPTTEAELDECVQALEEIRRACDALPRMTQKDVVECAVTVCASIDEILARLRNRKGAQ